VVAFLQGILAKIMTWIIGASALMGYAVCISDIRVTFADGSEKDCLQKLYPMSRFIAAGFAGSVRIGFSMLDALTLLLQDLPEGAAWHPEEVADCFQDLARQVFKAAPQEEQMCRSHLMLLGAHPTQDLGIPGCARCSVHVLRSPDFDPQLAGTGEVVSIGSGSAVAPYRKVLDGFSSNVLSLLRGEEMGARMGFLALSMVVQKTIEQNPTAGISPHAHICVVRRASIEVGTNDENRYPPSGAVIEIRMPSVATSWTEFVRMASSSAGSADGAVC
jgi:hypothetical protein